MQLDNRLKIALQKSGKMADGSRDLLNKCGLNLKANNKLLVKDDTFGVDFMMLRDDDIPGLLDKEVCDLGIMGENLLAEYKLSSGPECDLQVIKKLNFSFCRLSIAVPKNGLVHDLADLQGRTIATSYPHILKDFLKREGIKAKVVIMHGSVEMAPKIGIADVVCDLVSSGATLAENGLKEMTQILESQAVLVGRSTYKSSSKLPTIERLVARMRGVIDAAQSKYIMLHAERSVLSKIRQALPGCEAPTILELEGMPGKVAVHAVSQEKIFWDTVENLKEAGATSILVLPIEKMMEV